MLSTKRLRKENLSLQNEPVPLALARPLESNILEWRFLIKGSDDYEGGFYHGKLIFPPQYPMKPPGIMFFTPSGRFEINKRVCLTISDFHPESWSPLWTVGSILTGIVSFMNSDELTTGGIASSSKDRKAYALASTAYNAKDHTYNEVFGTDSPVNIFEESNIKIDENIRKRIELRKIQQKATDTNNNNNNNNNNNYNNNNIRTNTTSNSSNSTSNSNSNSNLNLNGKSESRAMFTNSSNSNSNSNSSLNGSADHSLLSPLKSVTAVAVVKTPLTKSAKKRMKEKERALRMKENGGNDNDNADDSDGEEEVEVEEGKGKSEHENENDVKLSNDNNNEYGNNDDGDEGSGGQGKEDYHNENSKIEINEIERFGNLKIADTEN